MLRSHGDMFGLLARTQYRQPRLILTSMKLTSLLPPLVSHLYGFGLMDAEAMVTEAEKWTTVPQQHVCVESTDRQIK